MLTNEIVGICATLFSAASWAGATVLWRTIGSRLSALNMNFIKSLLGVFFLGLLLFFRKHSEISWQSIGFLSLSGIIGVGLGDVFYFKALSRLGPRKVTLLGLLIPCCVVVVGVLLLRERFPFSTWIGIGITIIGIFFIDRERSEVAAQGPIYKDGIIWAMFFIACTSCGIILAKIGIKDVDPVYGAFVRILSGLGTIICIGIYKRKLFSWIKPIASPDHSLRLFAVVMIGIYGGFLFSIVGLKFLPSSIASTLNSTTPLFVIPLTAVFFHEKIRAREIIGAIITVAGVALIFFTGKV